MKFRVKLEKDMPVGFRAEPPYFVSDMNKSFGKILEFRFDSSSGNYICYDIKDRAHGYSFAKEWLESVGDFKLSENTKILFHEDYGIIELTETEEYINITRLNQIKFWFGEYKEVSFCSLKDKNKRSHNYEYIMETVKASKVIQNG